LFHVPRSDADSPTTGALSIAGGIVKMVPLTSVGDFYDGDEILTTATRKTATSKTATSKTAKNTTAKNGERT
jgi:hypothetical protein